MRASLYLVPLVVILASCRSTPTGVAEGQSAQAVVSATGSPMASGNAVGTGSPPADGAGYRAYGARIGAAPKVPLGDVLTKPEGYSERTVLVEGAVRRACTHRGCWMELAESMDPAAEGCRVTFKDYGFFVPTDSAGAHARVEGVVHVATVPAERVAHLESEGARFANRRPDGTAREVQLVATGAELRK